MQNFARKYWNAKPNPRIRSRPHNHAFPLSPPHSATAARRPNTVARNTSLTALGISIELSTPRRSATHNADAAGGWVTRCFAFDGRLRLGYALDMPPPTLTLFTSVSRVIGVRCSGGVITHDQHSALRALRKPLQPVAMSHRKCPRCYLKTLVRVGAHDPDIA
jgi:hypothetical protein